MLRFIRTIALACLAGAGALSAYGTAGDLYFSSFNDGTVYRKPSTGNNLTVFASGISHPGGLAFDRAGNLFVAESGANRILKITPAGNKTPFATGLNGPQSVVFDSAGALYCSDLNGNAIYKFMPDGSRTTFASSLNGPSGLAFNAAGELIASEVRAGTVSKFSSSGAKTPFASGLDLPTGIAVDRFGNVFVAEFGQHRVIKFASDGTPLPFSLVLDRPFILLFDYAGSLLVADNAGGIIYSAPPGGNFATVTSADAPSGLAIEPANSPALNISTRLKVLTGDNVLIAGFILTGTESKKVIVRGMGPSLGGLGIADPLLDPNIELNGAPGGAISNDDWKENEAEVAATGIPPGDDRESSLVKTLAPGSYTVIERGKANGTGVGIVELYDLQPGTQSSLANISTRGFVDVGTNVMIGGFIIGSGNGSRILVRGLGPSLGAFGVTGVLADPTLELRDQHGDLIAANDSWKTTQRAEIETAGLAPADDLEAALVAILPAGNYTAVLAGSGGGSGIGLVELYNLR